MTPVAKVALLALFGMLTAARPATAAPVVVNYPPGGLIQSIVLSGPSACIGDHVFISVDAKHPTDPNAPVEVFVDGWPGAPQALQYHHEQAAQPIRVYATTADHLEDEKQVEVDVVDCQGPERYLRLFSQRSPFHRYTVDFHVKPSFAGRVRAFVWNFGDGTSQATIEPFVSHDYSKAIEHTSPYSTFVATVQDSQKKLITGRRIALASSFDLSRAMGFAQAEVATEVTPTADGGVTVGLAVTNHDAEPITFTRYLKQYLHCDPEIPVRWQDVSGQSIFGAKAQSPPAAGPPSPGIVEIRTGQTEAVRFTILGSKIPPDVCGIGYNLIGETSSERPAYGSFYFRVRRNLLLAETVTDGNTLEVLKKLVDKHLVPNEDLITNEELYLLDQRGFVKRSASGWEKDE